MRFGLGTGEIRIIRGLRILANRAGKVNLVPIEGPNVMTTQKWSRELEQAAQWESGGYSGRLSRTGIDSG